MVKHGTPKDSAGRFTDDIGDFHAQLIAKLSPQFYIAISAVAEEKSGGVVILRLISNEVGFEFKPELVQSLDYQAGQLATGLPDWRVTLVSDDEVGQVEGQVLGILGLTRDEEDEAERAEKVLYPQAEELRVLLAPRAEGN
jgi:hypothetical protein